MTAQEQIARLESLLERIRRNADKPRRARGTTAAVAPASAAVAAVEAPAAIPAKPSPPVIEPPPPAAEEVSLESLGATEAQPAAEAMRDRVQSADMEELDIVEIASDLVEIGATDAQSPSSDAELEEPVPESAPRPAVQSVEVELEPPVKTPPPESGRQAVTPPPPIPEARVPAVGSDDDFDEDDLLQTDHSGGPISLVTPGAPAELGDTAPTEGAAARSAGVGIDRAPPVSAPSERVEAKLVERGAAGAYEATVSPPPTASAELERHREPKHEAPSRRVDPLAATVPDVRTALGFAKTVPDTRSPFADAIRATTEAKAEAPPAPVPEAAIARAPAAEAAPAPSAPELVVERPASDVVHVAEVLTAKPRRLPESFLELLDGSLELRA